MLAVVITGPQTMEVVDVPDPRPGPHEVLVRVAGSGICGTDLHILEGDYTQLPVIPGHEFAGEVVDVGADVTRVRRGDVVAADPSIFCHRCRYCRSGRANLCLALEAVGVTVAGSAAELVVVREESCVVMPNLAEPADGALVEPLSCVVHAFDLLPRKLADRYLIYGAGTMGLLTMVTGQLAGAVSIDVVDPQQARLDRAAGLGASRTATTAEELADEDGYDVVIDCTGVVPAMEDGIRRVGRGGTFLHFGVARHGSAVSYDPNHVLQHEVTIVGSKAVQASFERAASLLDAGLVKADDFITHRLPLSRYSESIDLFRRGEGLKVQVQPGM